MNIRHRPCASDVFLQLQIAGSEKVNLHDDSFVGGMCSILPSIIFFLEAFHKLDIPCLCCD